ncbi:hypothetical protein D1872_221670 [compost metagenome]
MPLNQLLEGFLHTLTVQITLNKHHTRHVIANLSTLKLAQQIQPLLSRRDRVIRLCLNNRDSCVCAMCSSFQQLSHLLNSRCLEYLSQREVHI